MENTSRLLNGVASPAHEEKPVKQVTDVIGTYGSWQRFLFFLICLRGIPTAFFNMSTSFFAPTMDFWCARPSDLPFNLTAEQWKNSSIPMEQNKNGDWHFSQCKMFEVVVSTDTFVVNKSKIIDCDRWEYDNSFYTWTILEEFNLVCENDWLISLTQSIYMAGMMVGVFIFGHLADRFGRQIILNLSVTLMVGAAVVTAFCSNFIVFNVVRFALALGVAGVQNTSFCLLMEILGPEYRTRVTFAFSFGWAFGLLCLPGMAYVFRNWVHLQLFSALLTSVLLCYWYFMPESPRWLITQGELKKAETVMLAATKKNKIHIEDMAEAVAQLKIATVQENQQKKSTNIIDLFRTSKLRKHTLCVYIVYFSSGFVFYGFLLGQTTFGPNPFLNFFIGSLVEIPAYVLSLFFIKLLKRRTALFIFNLTAAVACFFLIPLDEEYHSMRVVAAMIGKMSISGSFLIIAIHAAEIFPTVVRTVGAGTSLMMGRVGAMTAPFVKEIGMATHEIVPPIILGLLSFLAALLVLPLPETHNKHLTDTIKEAENSDELSSADNTLLQPVQDTPESKHDNNCRENKI